MDRRAMLRLFTAGAGLSLTGCLSTETRSNGDTADSTRTSTNTPEDQTHTDTPVEDGEASAPPSCPSEYTPLEPSWVVEGPGPLGGFDLSLDTREIQRGDTLNATLTNVTNEEHSSGIKQKYDIQYQSESGWHTIFGTEEDYAVYLDLAIAHPPGEGFSWQLEFTQEGLTDAVDDPVTYHVCTSLDPGTYRFVYWGITTEREAQNDYETDYALGVPFSVSQD